MGFVCEMVITGGSEFGTPFRTVQLSIVVLLWVCGTSIDTETPVEPPTPLPSDGPMESQQRNTSGSLNLLCLFVGSPSEFVQR